MPQLPLLLRQQQKQTKHQQNNTKKINIITITHSVESLACTQTHMRHATQPNENSVGIQDIPSFGVAHYVFDITLASVCACAWVLSCWVYDQCLPDRTEPKKTIMSRVKKEERKKNNQWRRRRKVASMQSPHALLLLHIIMYGLAHCQYADCSFNISSCT